MMQIRTAIALVFLAGSVACATGGSSEALLAHRQLLNRAAFDLDCTTELNVSELDGKTRSVGGCGRQATYVQICDAPYGTPLRSCVWVMNGKRGNF